jgi:hypothetical protein
MSDHHHGLRTGELMKKICGVLEAQGELSYSEITEADEFAEIPDWKLMLAIRKLLYAGDVAETEANTYRLNSCFT